MTALYNHNFKQFKPGEKVFYILWKDYAWKPHQLPTTMGVSAGVVIRATSEILVIKAMDQLKGIKS